MSNKWSWTDFNFSHLDLVDFEFKSCGWTRWQLACRVTPSKQHLTAIIKPCKWGSLSPLGLSSHEEKNARIGTWYKYNLTQDITLRSLFVLFIFSYPTDNFNSYELKQHKPWFEEEHLGFLDQRKQAKMQWVQDPNQSNVDNLNNVTREASRHFRNKKNIWKLKLMTLKLKLRSNIDGFGGLVVSILATGTRVRGFKPGRSRWIFRASGKSSVCLPSEGKQNNAPYPSFAAFKRT